MSLLIKRIDFFTLSLPSESASLDLKVHNRDILGDPGAVSWAGRKCATKVYKHGRKSPWVRTLTGSFPNGQANAGSWLGTNNALYYCAQSANSISCVLFVSSYTTAIISPHLPGSFTKLSQSETKELSMSPKTFGCYQQEQFNLHWQNYVSDRPQCIVNNRMFTMQWKREVKKAIAWQGKTTILHVQHHAFLCISLPSLHDYHVKMPNVTFSEGLKQTMTKCSFSLWTWIWLTDIQLQKGSLAFDNVSELE